MRLADLLLGFVLLNHAVAARGYAATFRNDGTLWENAVRVSPQKPRVLVNLAMTRIADGDIVSGRWLLEAALSAANRDDLPSWDVADAREVCVNDLVALHHLMRVIR